MLLPIQNSEDFVGKSLASQLCPLLADPELGAKWQQRLGLPITGEGTCDFSNYQVLRTQSGNQYSKMDDDPNFRRYLYG